MLAAGDLARIADVCTAIGNEATDESGFVPVRRLLSCFQAELDLRPLLVEGMLASKNGQQWVVLVDSEKYPYTQHDVEQERLSRPLPERMRNTIAHELVHSFAFRSSAFGLQLKTKTDSKESLREFVKDLERETEQLSPLLLWPEKALAKLLHGRKDALTLFDLLDVVEAAGISRYVLVNRLRLVRPATDEKGFLFSAGLRDLAVGLGVWTTGGAYIKGWPLFWNFDDGNVPSFLLKAHGHDRIPAEALFSDGGFAMLGGPNTAIEIETDAGTKAAPTAKKIRIQIAVEEGLRRLGEEFLFVVRKSVL